MIQHALNPRGFPSGIYNPANCTILVSGAGIEEANGVYTHIPNTSAEISEQQWERASGQYHLVIRFLGNNAWEIADADGIYAYYFSISNEGITYPWEADAWMSIDVAAPAPSSVRKGT